MTLENLEFDFDTPAPHEAPIGEDNSETIIDQLDKESNIIEALVYLLRGSIYSQLSYLFISRTKRDQAQAKSALKRILKSGSDHELNAQIRTILQDHRPATPSITRKKRNPISKHPDLFEKKQTRIPQSKRSITPDQEELPQPEQPFLPMLHKGGHKPRIVSSTEQGGPTPYIKPKVRIESPWRDDLLMTNAPTLPLVPRPNGQALGVLDGKHRRQHPSKIINRIGNKANLMPLFDHESRPLIPRVRLKTFVDVFGASLAVLAYMVRSGRVGPETQIIISEYEEDTFDVYEAIRRFPEELIRQLDTHQKKMGEAHYNNLVKEQAHGEDIKRKGPLVYRAARTITIAKGCFGSVTRKNKFGHINVKYRGDNAKGLPPKLYNAKNIRLMSQVLQNATLICGQYTEFLNHLPEDLDDSFIYMDPPYDGQETTNEYGVPPFTAEDQRNLAHIFKLLKERGAWVAASNADTQHIREIYQPHAEGVFPILDNNNLGAQHGNGDNKRKEVFISSYRLPWMNSSPEQSHSA